MKKIIHTSCSEGDTARLAANVSSYLHAPLTLFLRGELGTGKTTFVRGLLQGLGYEGVVKSPTYTLVEPYEVAGRSIYHFDLYRLSCAEELEYAGGRDYFSSTAICLVEWPERAQSALPLADLELELTLDDSGSGRRLSFSARSTAGEIILLAAFPQ